MFGKKKPVWTGTRWEYLTFQIKVKGIILDSTVSENKLQKQLNAYGNDGWELVSTSGIKADAGAQGGFVCVMKRQLE